MRHAESEYPPRPLSGRELRRIEVEALAELYFNLREVDHAVDVAFIESGWRTDAWNTVGEDSRGLWQINVGPGAHPELSLWNLWDPMLNAYYAAQIYDASGWAAWLNSARRLNLPT
jgi:hypothetical protein